MHGFHAGGSESYAMAFRAEYEAQKRTLKELLRHAETLEERNRLAEELRELKSTYKAKSANWGYSLF
jgi:hypothetical protein